MADFFIDFISTIGILALAEFADKTNLVALSLMAKYQKPYTVALGGMLGIALVTLIGVIIGVIIGDVIPLKIVPIVAGSVFIWIGVSELLEDDDEIKVELKVDEAPVTKKYEVLFNSIFFIGLAEFGDKSQIFVITRAIDGNPVGILFGAIIGMGIIMVATAFFGDMLIEKLPEETIHKIALYGFIIAGSLILVTGIYNY